MRIDKIASNAKYRCEISKRRTIPKLENFFENLRYFSNFLVLKFDN